MAKKSKVWFSSARSKEGMTVGGLIHKVKDLFYEAGISDIISNGDIVAIKVHIGEWNRTRCLRPEFVAAVVEEVKEMGGKPFVCDTTTLSYDAFASRCDAYSELQTAYRHGWTPEALGCPFIVADGILGDDDVHVDIPEGKILKETYIARAIANADVLLPITHFKAHPLTSMGGAIKNIGIGAQSKRGKYVTHLALWGDPSEALGYPQVDPSRCKGLECPYRELCEQSCPEGAIKIDKDGLHIDLEKCKYCFSCVVTCSFIAGQGALSFKNEFFPAAQIAMADAALGCLKTKKPDKVGFISYAIDIDAVYCDCFPTAELPVCPDLGVFASKDPVAIDTACLDMVDNAPIMPGSIAEELGLKPGEDKFKATTTGWSPRIQLKAAQDIGMGSMEYELITYSPVQTPETVGKWQQSKIPSTVKLAEYYKIKHPFSPPYTPENPPKRVSTKEFMEYLKAIL
ncbi:iron-sulfur cluster-binding protein [Thermococci archaeon]|nr:MAG: iron-sulfur cluster-binding protein [Thermococci archaeon]